jgi:histidyl-tRNA synthetase
MKTMITSVKGTRDYYPVEMALRTWLYQTVRQVSESFGYQEFDGPFLESVDLYAAKSGEELVNQQSYVFPDRSGELITLRPELTPSLARMIVQRQRQLQFPLRWWSWGPFWRYERPQKGRSREFFQWNIDLIGIDSPLADVEMISIVATFLKQIGLSADQVSVLVNDRQLMESELHRLHISDAIKANVFKLIDRREKMIADNWHANAIELGLTDLQVDGLISLLSDENLWQKSERLVDFFSVIQSTDIKPYVHYSPKIIRGLDYYTDLVFETWDRDGEFRSILGGGRYDRLVADVGGGMLPAIGFAMGDAVISLVLKKFNCLPADLGENPADILVTIFDEQFLPDSLHLATELRQAGFRVACYPEITSLSRQMKYGDRAGIPLAIIYGPDEKANQMIALKNYRTGDQVSLPQAQMVAALKGMLVR